jgi:DNA-binding FrmR family transcriptional regulator
MGVMVRFSFGSGPIGIRRPCWSRIGLGASLSQVTDNRIGYPIPPHRLKAIIKRLKRAEGHLRSIVTMLEEGRDCLEIAQQMQAVESAVGNAKKTLVHDHIDHCLEHAVEGVGARDAISQFKAITKYL